MYSCDCSVVRDLGSGPCAQRRSIDQRDDGSRPPAGEPMPRLPHCNSFPETAANSEIQGMALALPQGFSRRRVVRGKAAETRSFQLAGTSEEGKRFEAET